MHGFLLKVFLAVLLLVGGGSHAGLVHHRNGKESIAAAPLLATEALTAPKDHIPVAIVHDPEPALPIQTDAPAAPVTEKSEPLNLLNEVTNSVLPTEIIEQPQSTKTEIVEPELPISEIIVIQSTNLDPSAAPIEDQTAQSLLVTSNEEATAIPADNSNIKALSPEGEGEGVAPALTASTDEIERQAAQAAQATQATPTQTSTPQNFVAQLIQNSPIGQFLSQFAANQPQQQQQPQPLQPQPQPNQPLADQPATPAPTLPGFLNPGAAITSAQQAVQNAAQSVVNSTTQAFQGLQQFATNLGTQFQNTFSTLAGQQNQLSTADSTTPRPPGPIQSIVNSIVNPPTGQQQGPLQGILSFFQGGNRPQNGTLATDAPPKEEPTVAPGVSDKIETQQNDVTPESAINSEPDTNNEVIKEEESFEEAGPEELIVVNDDAAH